MRNYFRVALLAAFTAVAGFCLPAFADDVSAERVDLTGSWYVPENPGHGFLFDDAPEGLVVYWFNYTTDVPTLSAGVDLPDGQVWFISDAAAAIDEPINLYRPDGTFNGWGGFDVGEPVGLFTIEIPEVPAVEGGVGYGDVVLLTYRFLDFGPCTNPPSVFPEWAGCEETLELFRLTRAADDGGGPVDQ